MLQQHSMSTQQRFKKRERTQNWAYEEKRFLLELCRKDMHIVENKRLDSALTSLKNRAWKIIHQQFALTFGTDRNCNRLKEQWRRMKACTRAEMLDYQHRVSRYGQEAADKKRPSQFTFEIWEFMQEAKKACRNELMDDVDYSKVKLSLEESLPNGIIVKDDLEEEEEDDGDHDGENMMWDKTSQNICEVQITEESPDDEDDDRHNILQISRIRTSNSALSSSSSGEPPNKQSRHSLSYLTTGDSKNYLKNNSNSLPALSINNMAATLDTLNLLKNQFNYSLADNNILRNNNNNNNNNNLNNNNINANAQDDNATDKYVMQMKRKEHAIRMEILQTELDTAKINRDCAELNKQLALKRLSDSLKFPDT